MSDPLGAPPRLVFPSARALSVAVFLVVALTFLPSLRNGFVDWDDHVTIVDNPRIRALGWDEVRWMFTTFLLGPYQPISWLSLGVDYSLWGSNPAGYHLTSLLLHAANAVLVFWVAKRLLGAGIGRAGAGAAATRAPSAAPAVSVGAVAASLFFALHPLRVESVVWATERRDVLTGFFLLLSLLAYLRAAATGPIDDGSDGRPRFPVASFALFVLALLSKASVMAFPLVLLVLDVYPLRRLPRSVREWTNVGARVVLREKIPFALSAVAVAGVAVYGQATARALRTLEESGLAERAAYAVYAAGFYIAKSLAPLGLSPLYEAPPSLRAVAGETFASAAFVAGLVALAVRLRERVPGLLVACASYLALLAPVSGILHAGTHIAADRYTYLPCLPWAILLGGGAARLLARVGRSGAARSGVLLLAGVAVAHASLAALTTRQIAVWRDTLTLWEHAARLDPGSAIAHFGRGHALATRGRAEQAIAAYREAVRLDPGYADARNNLGTLLAESGRLREAEEQFLAIEAVYPNDALLQYNLAIVADRLGRTEEAKTRYRAAIARQPAMASARVNLSIMLESEGRHDEAQSLLREGLALAPGDSLLVRALARSGLEESRSGAR